MQLIVSPCLPQHGRIASRCLRLRAPTASHSCRRPSPARPRPRPVAHVDAVGARRYELELVLFGSSISPYELRSSRAKPVEKVRHFGRHRPDWPPRPVARGPSIRPISAVERRPWPRPTARACPLFSHCPGHACPWPWRCARRGIDTRRPLRAGTPRRAGRRSMASSRPWSVAAGHARRPDCRTHQVG